MNPNGFLKKHGANAFRKWIVPILFAWALAGPAYAGTLVPAKLRCEYLDNPLGIDAAHPRLSWIDASSVRGDRQTAYRILVATDEGLLRKGRGDLWDSGKVGSDQTAQVSYAGCTLDSGERAWWSVQTWDKDGDPSSWSPPAFWETGLLAPGDWHGVWIARSPYEGVNAASRLPTPLLRRSFDLRGKVKRARAYILGLGYFELSVNGQRIGDHLLDPGYTAYDHRILYVTHDISSALHPGENAIGVALGNGWYDMPTVTKFGSERAPWRGTPRLLIEVQIEMTDGRTVTIDSDPSWKTSDSPVTFSSVYGGETYDARLEQPGWDRPGFDDKNWQQALPVDAPRGKIVAQAMVPIALDQTIRPVAVTQPAPGVYLFDAGQDLSGNAEIALSGPAGTTVTLRYAEELTPDGRLNQAVLRDVVNHGPPGQPFQTENYVLRGKGFEHWHSRFDYNGFRYVEVTGAPGPLTADNLTFRFFHSAAPKVSSFECSNPLLNKIWQSGRWSYLSNLMGIPTDCPQREKNGWTGDAQIAAEQGLFYADGITVYEKWMNDIADTQRESGLFSEVVPTAGYYGYGVGGSPAWDSAFFLIPWYLYQYYGDSTALRSHYGEYINYINNLLDRRRDGIFDTGRPDWAPWKTRTPSGVTDMGYLYRDVRIVGATARLLGRTKDAEDSDKLANDIRLAFNKAYYHPDTGSYANGSQTALGCALYQGIVEPQNETRVMDNLVRNIMQDNQGHLDFGFLGAQYVLNTLTDHERADVAYTMVNQKTQPGWGWWIEQGATSLWEDWRGGDADGGIGGHSRDHTFFGDVNAWMMKTLAGINPDPAAPGFKHIFIKPNPVGDLTWAKGSYDSVRGLITSEWHKEDNILWLSVTIPANTTATVFLPADAAETVRENGKPLAGAGGDKLTRFDAGSAEIEIGSGHYEFTSARP